MKSDHAKKDIISVEKKPLLILHIGSPKTGTTALQSCLVNNQALLLENKICYTNFHTFYAGHNNHSHIIHGIIHEYYTKNRVPISALYSYPYKSIIESMKQYYHQNNCTTLIISSEYLFETNLLFPFPPGGERLLRERRKHIIAYFKEAFKEFDVKIVCYLRRQDNYIESLYNQTCKGLDVEVYSDIFNSSLSFKYGEYKYTLNEDTADNTHLAKFINTALDVGYYNNLSQWAEIYGKENIIVRPYEKSQLPKGIEYDFLTNVLELDSDLFIDVDLNKTLNASFSKDILEYKMATQIFDLHDEFRALNKAPALVHLNENNKKNILAAKQAEEILEYYREDNEKIAREYLSREDGILFYDKRREEMDDYLGLSLQATFDISRELVFTLKNQEQRLTAEISNANNHMSNFQKEIANLQNDINSLKEENLELHNSINRLNEENINLQMTIDISRELAITLKDQEQKLATELVDANTCINSLRNENFNFRQENSKILADIDKLNSENSNLRENINEMQSENSVIRGKLNNLQTENLNLLEEISIKQSEINNLLQSTSWKITKPLRAIRRLFSKR